MEHRRFFFFSFSKKLIYTYINGFTVIKQTDFSYSYRFPNTQIVNVFTEGHVFFSYSVNDTRNARKLKLVVHTC